MIRRCVLCALMISVGLACDDNETTVPAEEWTVEGLAAVSSGSRLHRFYAESESGEQVTLSFYDTQLEEKCRFLEIDGEYRCWPGMGAVSGFIDDACKQRAGGNLGRSEFPVYKCIDPNRYARGDDGLYRVVDLSEPHTGAIYRINHEGECEVAVNQPDRAWAVEPVSASTFVRADVVEIEDPAGLTVKVLEAEDGARAIGGVYSTRYGYRCEFMPDGACVPTRGVAQGFVWSDGQCVEAARVLESANAPLPEFVSIRGQDWTYSVHHRGPVTDEDMFFAADTCVEDGQTYSADVYAVGEEVAADTIPRLRPVKTGVGSLQGVRFLNARGDELHYEPAYWDRDLGTRCVPAQHRESDSIRCASHSATSVMLNDCSPDHEVSGILPVGGEVVEVASSVAVAWHCVDGIGHITLANEFGERTDLEICDREYAFDAVYERGPPAHEKLKKLQTNVGR